MTYRFQNAPFNDLLIINSQDSLLKAGTDYNLVKNEANSISESDYINTDLN